MAQALHSGHLGGAAFDVFDPEPLPEELVLRGDNVITLTLGGLPMRLASSVGSRRNRRRT